MVRKIAAGMQDVDNDHLVRVIKKHQKMFSCPDEPQVVGMVHENRTTPTMGLAVQDRLTSTDQFCLIVFGLLDPKIIDRPSGDLDQARLGATC